MSEIPNPSSSAAAAVALFDHHHSPPPSAAAALIRDYRKGNWTVQETLTLINAKRLDDERRSRPPSTSGAAAAPRSAEQRWKWVENYCWKNDCLRSQNQCNDKWDNLLRDYKKVRDYECRTAAAAAGESRASYWSMERHDRKDRNLPTNLSSEVFEALTDVLSRRNARRTSSSSSPATAAPISSLPPPTPSPAAQPDPPPPPPQPPAQPSFSAEASGSSGSDANEPETKRRKVRSLGSSVVRSASVLARTLLACEEKREQRHRELVELEERRLRMEEERTEMNRQAVSGLISAVNGLSSAIHALVSDHRGGDGR